MSFTISCIGCGKLGKTLLKLIKDKHIGTILGIVNRDDKSAKNAVEFTGQGVAYKTLNELPPSDIYLISTNDSSIQSICESLSSQHILKSGSIILHCSGFLSSDILISAKKMNCFVASVHPVKSFADPKAAILNFTGTYCGYEGDTQTAPMIKELFEGIGGKLFTIKKENKKLYHAASVISNNYLTTLHYHAVQNFMEAGIQKKLAKKLVSKMMGDTFNYLKTISHQCALTGPIQRGDTITIQGHMDALNDNPLVRDLYAALGKATLPITSHNDEIKKSIMKTLAPLKFE